jgi:hypothetical protein
VAGRLFPRREINSRPIMHRSLGSTDLDGLAPLPRKTPLVTLDEDFCLPVTGHAAPLTVLMPTPSASRREPPVLEPLDGFSPRPLPSLRSRREAPPLFVPFQPEIFAVAKDPWSAHSVADLIRFFLPELSIAAALMAGCGLMAGRLLARWVNGIQPLWVLGLYLAILFLHLGGVYLAGKGGSSSHLKASMRNLVFGLFFLLLPHSVAYLFLTVGG